MKIKTKLRWLVLVTILSLLITGGYAVYSNTKQMAVSKELTKKEELKYKLKHLQYLLAGYSNDERGFLVTGDPQYSKEMTQKKAELLKAWKQIEPMFPKKEAGYLNTGISTFLTTSDRVMQAYNVGGKSVAKTLHFNDERNVRKKLLYPALETLQTKVEDDVNQLAKTNAKTQNIRNYAYICLILVLIVVSSIITRLISRSILKPINAVNRKLKEISSGEGDLTQKLELKSKDEMGELAASFNHFIDSLRKLIVKISESTDHVASSAEQLTASAEQTSYATEQITESIQQVASGSEISLEKAEESAEKMIETAHMYSEMSNEMDAMTALTETTAKRAKTGGVYVHKTVEQMNKIQQSVAQTNNRIHTLKEHSDSIGGIVTIITDIANQTNLLALNASIEAARAGESGRGFAVVADEVRKLAEQSGNSASQIGRLITGIQEETKISLSSMDHVKEDVTSGLAVVKDTEDNFREILNAIHEIDEKIVHVAGVIKKLAESADEYANSTAHVAETAKETAQNTQEVAASTEEQMASMEEIAASAQSLSKLAEELQSLIGKFKF
ncbi:methyl-accepting chemotaxis protein [Fictibacillus gelatini]|uniref:methyl-accepting chemotaxis protein n=1 Tax=Fictibacillus gelatini TaxID=225985 RepID=UPI000414810F|nr:methyl-accepting chemotaxis protein [Fictibacillus gelatini]